MESSSASPTTTKKILNVVRVLYYMIRKGLISKQLLFKKGKIAGKSIANLSCRSMDPSRSVYNPRHVEFSCSNTPSYDSFHLNKRKNRKHHSYNYEAVAAIARAFELLNESNDAVFSDDESVAQSPMMFGFGKSPMMVRQLRITDSPFSINEGEVVSEGKVDKEADEFIKRFYEQLKIQQKTAIVTPEYKFGRG